MPIATARARSLKTSARKMRLVADLIRGKKVSEARNILQFTVKNVSPMLAKVLNAAVANAESKAAETRSRINTDDFVITDLEIGQGPTMRRFGTAPKGRGVRIRKRSSHVHLVISGE